MPNQAENRPEAKDKHILQGKYHPNFRLAPEDLEVIEQHQKEFGFKDRTAALRDILKKVRLHGLQLEEKIVDFQECEFYSVYPSHPELAKCREKGYWRNVLVDQCIACKLYKILKIPIMTPSRLEARFKDGEAKYHNLVTQTEKLKIEALQLDKNTERGLRKIIEELGKNWNLTQEILRDITQERDWLRIAKSPIEFDKKLHSDPLSHIQREAQKPSVGTYMAKEVTEKKVTKKFVQQQPQPKAPPQLILCPKTREMTVFEDVCKTCETVMECPNYNEIAMLNRVFGKR